VTDLAAYAEQLRREVPEVDKPGLEWVFAQPGLVHRGGVGVEFGVHGGSTLRTIAAHRGGAELWGFDSCRGLPEDWDRERPKGHFAMVNPPMPPDGVNLVVGWFKDTLPMCRPICQVTLAHVDCDLYSSTATALHWLAGRLSHGQEGWRGEVPRLASGLGSRAVIVFDDFLSKPYDNGVLRAFAESRLRDRIEFIARPRGSDVLVGRAKENST
jgi:hypothetical protein